MDTAFGVNLRVTGHCNQGGRKYMEDCFVVAYQQSEDRNNLEYAYFGIFDGHGGREAAVYAKEHLMNNIVGQKSFWSDDDDQVLKAIREGFLSTHQAMWREVGKWPKTVSGLPSTSGTTSSIAFIRNKKLYIGHVGDSKIVLGFQYPGSPEWCAVALTRDHKPESPEEKQRIQSMGGLVINKAGVERVVWNRPKPDHQGPIRRSTPIDKIPFLAVARSLGDLWSYNSAQNVYVVSPEPDVKVIDLNPHVHRCVMFGSDGLWNMLTTDCAVKIVQTAEEGNERFILESDKTAQKVKPPNNPSKLLVEAALKRWFRLSMRADNTSVITVMLDPAGPPKSKVLLKQRVMKRLRPRDEQAADSGISSSSLPDPAAPPTKKRKLSECYESSPPFKERKKCYESSGGGSPRSSENESVVPQNLPDPVILSPYQIGKQSDRTSPSVEARKEPTPSNRTGDLTRPQNTPTYPRGGENLTRPESVLCSRGYENSPNHQILSRKNCEESSSCEKSSGQENTPSVKHCDRSPRLENTSSMKHCDRSPRIENTTSDESSRQENASSYNSCDESGTDLKGCEPLTIQTDKAGNLSESSCDVPTKQVPDKNVCDRSPGQGDRLSENENLVPRNLPVPIIVVTRSRKRIQEKAESTKGIPVVQQVVRRINMLMEKLEDSPTKKCKKVVADNDLVASEIDRALLRSDLDRIDLILSKEDTEVSSNNEQNVNKKDSSSPSNASDRTDVSKGEKTADSPQQQNSAGGAKQQNVRAHLCEVNNFVKLDIRTASTYKTSTKPTAKVVEKKRVPSSRIRKLRAGLIGPKVKLNSRRQLRMHREGPRRNGTHNTRAHSGIQKLRP